LLKHPSIHPFIDISSGNCEIGAGAELSRASQKAIVYAKEVYRKNLLLLEEGFTPETNNVLERLFSLIDKFVDKSRSFKATFSTVNFLQPTRLDEQAMIQYRRLERRIPTKSS
jgi:hypothetical protein